MFHFNFYEKMDVAHHLNRVVLLGLMEILQRIKIVEYLYEH